MDRRSFLANGTSVLGAGIAGCIEGATTGETGETGSGGEADGTDCDASDPDDPDREFHFGLDGYDVDTSVEVAGEDDAPVSLEVDVEGDGVDDDRSVRFEFALTDGGDEPTTVFSGAPAPFGVVSFWHRRVQ